MFDHMKTCDDVKIGPGRTFDDVLMDSRDPARRGRQLRIWFHSISVKPFAGGFEEVAARTSGFEQLAGWFHFPDQLEPPVRIQYCEPVLFFHPKVSERSIRRAYFRCCDIRRFLSKREG